MNNSITNPWLVCQIGAREHYAIARALHARGALAGLLTDFWVPPNHAFSQLPGARRLRDRFHPDLANAEVHASNLRFLTFELQKRLTRHSGWPAILERNQLFQQMAIKRLASFSPTSADNNAPTLFSYSYAAREIFRYAKTRRWTTVLGQIDPGPEEERIVAEEHKKHSDLASSWQPAPSSYWDSWREELELADRIIVNSEWSRQCLLKEGVPNDKMEIVPLTYRSNIKNLKTPDAGLEGKASEHLPITRLLFLGQINLRKGVGRLLDAMRLLKGEPVELILAGPSDINSIAWEELPNVRWIGPVPRGETGNIYQHADCFILPTLSDGYALTQLEALSHGLPVIASKHCGQAVTHGQNGWILENLEPETIAAAIRHAMTEKLPNVRSSAFSLADLADHLLSSDS